MEKSTPHYSLERAQALVAAGSVLQGVMTMKCPVCGAANLIRDTRDIPYTYKGETTHIAAVTGDFCPACAESILDMPESRRVMREMQAFSQQVNAAYVDPEYIVSVRKKLKLDQREAADIFGGGVNAFSRYETGKTKPPTALVKLFKLLDRHPNLLQEVRAA
jgi:HTH-type transcriptional regulator / antitoxin MqsA